MERKRAQTTSSPRSINSLSGEGPEGPRVVVIIAAYNEAAAIEATVEAAAGISGVSQVVVVDDGSSDNTAELAELAGARVISLKGNIGKGGAVGHALSMVEGDVFLLIDGDVGATASEGQKLLGPVVAGAADMTIGVFPKRPGKGGLGMAKGFAAWSIRVFTGHTIVEPLSGQRAIVAPLAKSLRFDSGYGLETGITIDALRMKARVHEVQVDMTHAHTGRDFAGFVHRGSQLIAIMRAVAVRAMGGGAKGDWRPSADTGTHLAADGDTTP